MRILWAVSPTSSSLGFRFPCLAFRNRSWSTAPSHSDIWGHTPCHPVHILLPYVHQFLDARVTFDLTNEMRDIPVEVLLSWPIPNYTNPETRGNALAIVNYILITLVAIAVCLRLYVRIVVKRWFGSDDFFIIPSLVCLTGRRWVAYTDSIADLHCRTDCSGSPRKSKIWMGQTCLGHAVSPLQFVAEDRVHSQADVHLVCHSHKVFVAMLLLPSLPRLCHALVPMGHTQQYGFQHINMRCVHVLGHLPMRSHPRILGVPTVKGCEMP